MDLGFGVWGVELIPTCSRFSTTDAIRAISKSGGEEAGLDLRPKVHYLLTRESTIKKLTTVMRVYLLFFGHLVRYS